MFLIVISLSAVVLIAVVSVLSFLRSPRFGAPPADQRSDAVLASPHYRDGQFQNLTPTPPLREGASFVGIFFRFFFTPKERRKPKEVLPPVRTDLKALDKTEDVLVWFGHSSYFLQVDGKRFLVDPVFSGSASPIAATTQAFRGADAFSAEDMPPLDYLLLTHDHWDHLDYDTVVQLKSKVGTVVTGLGTGAHLLRWGFDRDKIIELDWWQKHDLGLGFQLVCTPARHFSGRGTKRNQSIWVSFVLRTPSLNLYLGGDSGYDAHFKAIGERAGPFDLAILECGQYNADWPYIHMMPGEWRQAATDLRAKATMPVHWGKFALALHSWDEPPRLFVSEMETAGIVCVTPKIGALLRLEQPRATSRWWEGIE